MLDKIHPENILFLDIETVPAFPEYSQLSERMKLLWDKKSERLSPFSNRNDEVVQPENSYMRAGIYAEFGKIICISVGAFSKG